MGIISRRIDPLKECEIQFNEVAQTSYAINKYFYPKPLRVGKKIVTEDKINIINL